MMDGTRVVLLHGGKLQMQVFIIFLVGRTLQHGSVSVNHLFLAVAEWSAGRSGEP